MFVVASRGPKSELHERPTMQCPCCNLPLQPEALGGEILDRCGQCGGEYVDRKALRRLLAAHSTSSPSRGSDYVRPSPFSDPVRYRKCPACGELMLRKNFRESSAESASASCGTWSTFVAMDKACPDVSPPSRGVVRASRRSSSLAPPSRFRAPWGVKSTRFQSGSIVPRWRGSGPGLPPVSESAGRAPSPHVGPR
jgi:Zn-finger nucleic acid-binding protein